MIMNLINKIINNNYKMMIIIMVNNKSNKIQMVKMTRKLKTIIAKRIMIVKLYIFVKNKYACKKFFKISLIKYKIFFIKNLFIYFYF